MGQASVLLRELSRLLRWPFDGLDIEDAAFRESLVHALASSYDRERVSSFFRLRTSPEFPYMIGIVDYGRNDVNRFPLRFLAYHLASRSIGGKRVRHLPINRILLITISGSGEVELYRHHAAAMAQKMPQDRVTLGSFRDGLFAFSLAGRAFTWLRHEDWSRQFPARTEAAGRKRTTKRFSKQYFEVRSELLSLIFERAQQFEPLATWEQDLYAGKAQNGCSHSRQKLINHHLEFLLQFSARQHEKLKSTGISLEDVFAVVQQEFNDAIDRFKLDYTGQIRHLWFRLARRAKRESIMQRFPINIPVYLEEQLEASWLGCPSFDHAKQEFTSCRNVYHLDLLDQLASPLLLQARLAYFCDLTSLADAEDVVDPGPKETFAQIHEIDYLRSIVSAIEGRDGEILEMRFGLGGRDPMTLEEVGKALGITRERTRQVEFRAKEKLRERLASLTGRSEI